MSIPPFLGEIVAHLHRRGIQVGIDDLRDLRMSLCAGFGLSSTDDLRDLCVTLWATSRDEADLIRAAFARVDGIPDWTADDHPADPVPDPSSELPQDEASCPPAQDDPSDPRIPSPASYRLPAGGGVLAPRTGLTDRSLVLIPQYPLTSREVAQSWRHLRRPVRTGPAVELDVAATIRERARRGVVTPPVVVPRRRNAVRILILIDRNGSMSPFHGYVDHVVAAIRDAGRVDEVRPVYFHDVPGHLHDRSVLSHDPFRTDLDPVLGEIAPLQSGRVYNDKSLTAPVSLSSVLAQVTAATGTLIISDGGAARGTLDLFRLLDTIALLKSVGTAATGNSGTAWLNPVPAGRWPRTTAAAISRHVPMYPFTRQGLDHAVDALRGRPVSMARPL